MRSILYIITVVLFAGCQGNENSTDSNSNEESVSSIENSMPAAEDLLDEETLRAEVEGLNNDHNRIAFLRNIISEDQRVRNAEIEANQHYGYDSPQHKASVTEMLLVDAQNLQRLDAYTAHFGMPEVNSAGRMYSEAAWHVVHHSAGTDARERYFPVFYFAWENELISGDMFTMYLNRYYERVSGNHHMMEGSYTEQEEVDELLELLNLNPD